MVQPYYLAAVVFVVLEFVSVHVLAAELVIFVLESV